MLDIQKNIILSQYSTFEIGGAAKEFVIAKNKDEIIEAIKYAQENNEDFCIIGGGSNILFSDKGFNGLVIKIQDIKYNIQNTNIECGSGLLLSELLRIACSNNLSRLEWAIGIPGTIGGAVRGNAGAYGAEIKDIVEEVEVLDAENLKITVYEKEKCAFGYRTSVFKLKKNLVILSVKFSFQQEEKEKIENKIREIMERRSKRIPQSWKGSAGSFFENPVVQNQELIKEFEKETGMKNQENKIPAGWLIERAGLAGKKIGNIMVSERNCNFILNLGDGTAEQVIIIVSLIKQKVRDTFNVQLKEEVQYIGF